MRAVGSDAAVMRAIAGMVPTGAESIKPEVNAVQSMVAGRRAGDWRVALFQNTPAQYHGRPDLVRAHTAELTALRGEAERAAEGSQLCIRPTF